MIAQDNDLNLFTLIGEIFRIFDLTDPKKSTIFLLGKSNAGKSYFAHLLTASWERWDVGVIVTTTAGKPNDYYSHNLVLQNEPLLCGDQFQQENSSQHYDNWRLEIE